MTPLYDPARHEPLAGAPWSEDAARAEIARIAASARDEFDAAQGNWPMHPRDDPPTPQTRHADLYFGAAGAFWALRDLASQGAIEPVLDPRPWLAELAPRARAAVAHEAHGTASYLAGECGAMLLHWSVTREPAVADALHALIRGNLHNSCREPLWGNSGTLLAAIHLAEASGEVRWMRLVQDGVRVLLDTMEIDPDIGTWIWVQDLYGRRIRYLGAGHGLVGNVYPALRGAALLDDVTVQTLVERARLTLERCALRDGGLMNWHPFTDAEDLARAQAKGKLPLVQDCHGAPGVVCRLAGAPRTPEWDALLLAAGELTWVAGPLAKGASLCHGTGNSAMAMLKLFRRSGDERWLDRARRFGMHMIVQVERHRAEHRRGRHALWTGDLGAACVLWNCIIGDDRFPTLDHF